MAVYYAKVQGPDWGFLKSPDLLPLAPCNVQFRMNSLDPNRSLNFLKPEGRSRDAEKKGKEKKREREEKRREEKRKKKKEKENHSYTAQNPEPLETLPLPGLVALLSPKLSLRPPTPPPLPTRTFQLQPELGLKQASLTSAWAQSLLGLARGPDRGASREFFHVAFAALPRLCRNSQH
jgi:hypothetical protein